MRPQDAEMDGYYDLIIEDDNDIIKYRSEEMLLFSHILSNEKNWLRRESYFIS